MRQNRNIVAALAALAFCGCAVQPAWAQTAKPIRIGLIAPLTGGSADFGNSVRHGAQLAVAEINTAGGYLGQPLELVVRDDKANPDVGRAAAEDLVLKEKVAYTIGFCNTGVALKALDVFETHQHLLMVPCSTGSALTRKTPAAQSYVFRMAPPDHLQAPFLVREVVQRRKLSKVAVFADRTGYGDGGVREVTAALAKLNLQPIYVGRYDLGVQDLAAELDAARKAGAEAVINYTVGPEQAVAVKGRAALGWKAPFLAPWTLSFSSVLESAGASALEGTLMVQSIIQDTANERRASFIARYARHSNEKRIGSLMAAAQSYDAVHMMLRALFQSKGDTRGPALKAALENLREPYRGVVTTFDKPFSKDDHDAFADGMVWLGVWRRGEIVYFYAEDAKMSSVMRRKAEAK
jgi:branched-chain amino acid transport system substrate-binding protein